VPSVVKALIPVGAGEALTTEGTEFAEKTETIVAVRACPFNPAKAPINPELIQFSAPDLTKATNLVVMQAAVPMGVVKDGSA